MGIQRKLQLGDLSAARDWGFAGDFVQAFWSMLQAETPDDYVLGTGKLTSIEEFLTRAFQRVDLKWQEHVEVNRDFLRKHDAKRLVADYSRAQSRLNWSPTTSLETLVGLMVDHDLAITDSLLNSSSNRKAA